MSNRAEKRALEAYPVVTEEHTERDLNKPRRLSFIKGYEQAIKDVIALIDSNFLPAFGGKIIRLIEQDYE